MEKFSQLITWVDGKVWGWGMILLLLGTHLFMTVRTGFIQRKTIIKGIKLSVSKEPDADGEVSQFGALATALASTIGTGNIIGVGTAVALGGPGAVLWCWLTGVFGIATKYSESLIAVKYRVKTEDGRMQGGAMYALERGLHMRWLGLIFAVFAGFASFGIGCATQVNAIAINANEITDGGVLTSLAFDQIPIIGPLILVVGIISFAFSTILGWAYYGERCVEYFAGKKGLIPYRVLYIAVAVIAPVVALDVVWDIADILNALMAIPNLIAVLLLSPVIVKETKKYLDDLDAKDNTEIPVIKK